VFAQGSVTDYPLTIRHRDGQLTDVLYNASVYKDAAGNVLGGGSGSSYGANLPPSTREVFKLTGGGFRDIPLDRAATTVVSATPTWRPVGAT